MRLVIVAILMVVVVRFVTVVFVATVGASRGT